MTQFTTPVAVYAHGPLISVRTDTPLHAVLDLLEERGISSVPVMDPERRAVGVLSRTDLLRIGTARRADGPLRTAVVDLPRCSAGEVMHTGVVTVTRETPVSEAARKMVAERKHRLFVTHDGAPSMEVFGTREAMIAIAEARIPTRIGSVMSRKPFTIPCDATVALATQRLEDAHVQGLVVVDPENWPIGLFTQREALLARAFEPSRPVEDAMSHGMLCLHVDTPLHRAAAQAAQTRARRVLVIDDMTVVGVLTGLDFARRAAHAF